MRYSSNQACLQMMPPHRSTGKKAFFKPEALTGSDMRSVTGPSEVTKGDKIFAKTALGCNFETSSQSSAEPLFMPSSESFCL
jgi:hypothetical protein